MVIPIASADIEKQLRQRGVRVVEKSADTVVLQCAQCGTRWTVDRSRLAPPEDGNTFWWCPEGCNREV